MRNTLKFLLSLTVAMAIMLGFRSLVFTIYTVEGEGLAPVFLKGDRVMVNRWSYGLRTGSDEGLFNYGRLCRQLPKKGDFIAYEDPRDSTGQSVLFGRCQALPGDTVYHEGRILMMPSLIGYMLWAWLIPLIPDNWVLSMSAVSSVVLFLLFSITTTIVPSGVDGAENDFFC